MESSDAESGAEEVGETGHYIDELMYGELVMDLFSGSVSILMLCSLCLRSVWTFSRSIRFAVSFP